MHPSTMLECKRSHWFLSESNMSCSLLTTVRSNKWQYLHQYCLFIWNVRMQHSMNQSCHNKIGVLTVCDNEQLYLHQNKIFLWHSFGFGITQNKDKHWEGLNRGSLGKIKWNVPFILRYQLVSHSFCIMFRLLSWNWKWHINQQGNMLSDTLNDRLLS